MQRIDTTFHRLAESNRGALITFITAGDPHLDMSLRLMHEVVAAGADIIEVGVPFSDPMADGPVIQRSSERSLAQNVNLRRVIDLVKAFRASNATTPIVLMGYTNPIQAFGVQDFVDSAHEADVDGVLTVDSPPEECEELVGLLKLKGILPIFLISPTTTEDRMAEIARLAQGFVYYVSLRGITGATHLDVEDVKAKIKLLRSHTAVPIGVGFGISNAETAGEVSRIADAVIVGSRIMQEIETPSAVPVETRVRELVAGMRAAMDEEEQESACI